MTKEIIKNVADSMVILMKTINRKEREGRGEYKDSFRKFPFYSEFIGMTHMLKIMGIDFEIDFDETVTYMTAITISGERFEVYQQA